MYNNKFKNFGFFLFFFFLFFFTFISNTKANIFFIDTNLIYHNSLIGKKIEKRINLKQIEIKNFLNDQKKIIEEDNKKINKQKNILSEEELKNRYQNLENKINTFNNIVQIENDKLDLYRKKLNDVFTEELRKIISEYASKNNIELVIEKNNIIIGSKLLDLTQTILDVLNNKVKDITIEQPWF